MCEFKLEDLETIEPRDALPKNINPEAVFIRLVFRGKKPFFGRCQTWHANDLAYAQLARDNFCKDGYKCSIRYKEIAKCE